MQSKMRFFGLACAIASVFFLVGCASVPLPSSASLTPSQTHTPQPTSAPAPTPSPASFFPLAKIIGTEEMVFDWSRDRCAETNIPDLPVRAFRDGEGMVQINLSFPTNFRMIGKDLDSLKTDCKMVLASDMDKDPSHFNYSEWMGSTYTLDGKTVYALIHNEFYGSESAFWYATRDYGENQGGNNWSYRSWNGVAYSNMQFDTAKKRWQGSEPLCQIGSQWAHPDRGCEPTRTWTSPVDATVTVSGITRDQDAGGGDGVIVKIFKGSTELWSATIENGDKKDYPFNLQVPVRVGDAIHFRVNARGNTNNDTTLFEPKINVGPDPCVSGVRDSCTMVSITFAQSNDGGKTYTQPAAPNHLVASLPIRYRPDWGLMALWQPSNIVKSPKDGYYYALLQTDYRPVKGTDGRQGTCVMRTKTLDDPKSWLAWDGKGYDMQFINPYTEPNTDPEKHTCQFVSWSEIQGLTYNLTYNSFFEKFVAVGVGTSARGVSGFYYSLSDDLIHWTPKQLLMKADLANTVNFQPPYLAYPSLVDPSDTSRNFEVTGQSPYMYFTRANSMSPSLDFDLLRVRIQFSK